MIWFLLSAGTYDYKFPVNEVDSEYCSAYCDVPSLSGVEEELNTRILQMMQVHQKQMPETSNEACQLLNWLLPYLWDSLCMDQLRRAEPFVLWTDL